jgi:hypothetical protein
MATVSITIPDEHIEDIKDVLAIRFNYDVGSGLTKAQFLKAKVAEWVKEQYKLGKGEQAAVTARDAVYTTVNVISIT